MTHDEWERLTRSAVVVRRVRLPVSEYALADALREVGPSSSVFVDAWVEYTDDRGQYVRLVADVLLGDWRRTRVRVEKALRLVDACSWCVLVDVYEHSSIADMADRWLQETCG